MQWTVQRPALSATGRRLFITDIPCSPTGRFLRHGEAEDAKFLFEKPMHPFHIAAVLPGATWRECFWSRAGVRSLVRRRGVSAKASADAEFPPCPRRCSPRLRAYELRHALSNAVRDLRPMVKAGEICQHLLPRVHRLERGVVRNSDTGASRAFWSIHRWPSERSWNRAP